MQVLGNENYNAILLLGSKYNKLTYSVVVIDRKNRTFLYQHSEGETAGSIVESMLTKIY
jgi:hypothetical protein